jgi:hypothetical protein
MRKCLQDAPLDLLVRVRLGCGAPGCRDARQSQDRLPPLEFADRLQAPVQRVAARQGRGGQRPPQPLGQILHTRALRFLQVPQQLGRIAMEPLVLALARRPEFRDKLWPGKPSVAIRTHQAKRGVACRHR